jgi:hypothetical protein
MAELSPRDAELLVQDLPELAQVAVASSIYFGHEGRWNIVPPEMRVIPRC